MTALFGLYPLWWAIGLGELAFIVFAVPMAADLLRRRRLRTPPGFGIWLLFLLWALVSAVMFPINPPNTTVNAPSGRVLGLLMSELSYGAATVALLYILNLPKRAMPDGRLMRLMCLLFVYTVAGGILGVVAPRFSFTAPLERLIPATIRANSYTQALIHPYASEIQNVLGSRRARPVAPWGFSNLWGYNLSLLGVWWFAFVCLGRSRQMRAIGFAVCLIAIVPIIYSLDRALWAGLAISIAFLLVSVIRRKGAQRAMGLLALLAVGGALLTLTPLRGIVAQRAAHGESDAGRAWLSAEAVRGAKHSPIIGYGGPRKTIGNNLSVAVGPTAKCPDCGAIGVGSNGQLWIVLFAQGFVGAILYFGYFLYIVFAHARDRTMIGRCTVLIVILSLFYAPFYNAVPAALMATMLSIGLTVRNRFAATVEPSSVSTFAPATAT